MDVAASFSPRGNGLLPTAAQLFERLPRTLRRHRLMKAYMALTGESPLQLVRIRDRHFGYADMSDGFLRLIVIDGDFEREFFALADALLARGGVFIDAGANFGLLSCGLAGQHGAKVKFHVFEPNPALVQWIERSAARYPVMDCKVNCAAVSDCDGSVSFNVNVGQTGASHISFEGGEQVRSVTIDAYLDRENIATVPLMKMDIEGYELTAVRGAAKSLQSRRIQAVYFEYFEKYLIRVAPPRDLLAAFDALGFEVCFCRQADIAAPDASLTIRADLPGHGIALRPVAGQPMPPMTDLLAVPKENLAAL
ncbi:MAG: FkbM family methyltransferase [Xanthobacteraceae bacterium]